MTRSLVVCLWVLAVCPLQAHHSNAEYDRSALVELQGVIARVIWRNPHVGLALDVRDEAGETTRWTLGAADLAGTLRRGVPEGTFRTGQRVRVAGYASTRRPANMLVTNVLLPDGREVLMTGFAEPHFSGSTLGGGNWVAAAAVGSDIVGQDIFRVWTLERTARPAFTANPPLTPLGRQALLAYDPFDDPALRCESIGMPRIITRTGPHPIAFVKRGADILQRIEYFDAERIIHMDRDTMPANVGDSPLGYSIGHWDGDALVVETAHVDYPYFDINGLEGAPQGPGARFLERYTLAADGTELHMDISVTDPETFTRMVVADDYAVWKWRPDIRIMPYDCRTD